MVGLRSDIRRFLRGCAGNVAIMSTVMMPILVGFAGLGMETAMWYQRQRELQGAADIAAYGAALVRRSGGSASDATTSATEDAAANGWRQAIGTIAVNSPPTSGAYQNAKSVEVVLTENHVPLLTKIYLGSTPVVVRARSTATTEDDGPACILGLNTSSASTVRFWGNSSATMNNCNVASNSTHASGFEVGGSADLTVPCAYSSGGSSTDSGLMLTQCADVVEEHPPVADPYASVPAPTWGSCGAMPNGSTINPGGGTVCYNSGTTINNATKTFGANSTVVISGTELRINGNATVNGTGVTFYLTNGATLRINGGAMLNLSAPTSGTHAGLLFFGDRTQASAVNRINGNSSGFMQGAIYFPSQEIDFSGNTGNHGCLQVIGDKITYTGSSTFNNNCAGTGVKTITVSGDIMLVE